MGGKEDPKEAELSLKHGHSIWLMLTDERSQRRPGLLKIQMPDQHGILIIRLIVSSANPQAALDLTDEKSCMGGVSSLSVNRSSARCSRAPSSDKMVLGCSSRPAGAETELCLSPQA